MHVHHYIKGSSKPVLDSGLGRKRRHLILLRANASLQMIEDTIFDPLFVVRKVSSDIRIESKTRSITSQLKEINK
jgi:hypothetical protein